ncbi:hypothetical protein AB0A74_20165 [Saccharothrix sp. NPDC042600]|uniref:alpha/beta fold hydrolase n=1 Tax=Saccharothrix TaxID=2071 RepID=UPI00340FCC58|nr:hypothetical protein GCM10017745_75360 [Saccharothrix mutabilis subsp. capreolus]
MARVVVVHGIGRQYLGPRSMHGLVAPALVDGVRLAGGPGDLTEDDVAVAFYGDWFRPSGGKGEPLLTAEDLDSFEEELLVQWWQAAAETEPHRVPSPGTAGLKVSTPVTVQRALDALSRSRFFAGVGDRFLIGVLRQVKRYLTESSTRQFVRSRVVDAVDADTVVLVGHSLGSVVAYEALCAHPEWRVRAFVTLGSPLGIRNLVFDRLDPSPTAGRGHWPGSGRRWTNICDCGDVVALVKDLAPLFGEVVDRRVDNGWRAHALAAHLTAVETGAAVAAGLVE